MSTYRVLFEVAWRVQSPCLLVLCAFLDSPCPFEALMLKQGLPLLVLSFVSVFHRTPIAVLAADGVKDMNQVEKEGIS